jgi:aminopeptidase YwaD
MVLLNYIKGLELKNNRDRGEVVKQTLRNMGLQPDLQKLVFPRIENIILDFSDNLRSKKLVLSAHYDVVAGSPGANDDASGTAVLLGLCRYLKDKPAPVRVIFFDREEAWFRAPLFRLGLLGSQYYALKNNLHNIAAVYNLELVGNGDFLGIWPVKEREKNLSSVKRIEYTADEIKVPHLKVYIPWLILSGDHLPFRLKGMADAISLSLLPKNLVNAWQDRLFKTSAIKRLWGGCRQLPEPVSLIHSSQDNSSNTNENSLQLMLSLLVRLINDYSTDRS